MCVCVCVCAHASVWGMSLASCIANTVLTVFNYYNYIAYNIKCMDNHVHRALLENTYIERMRKEKDKGNAQKRLTLLNK